jgi:hypothetical protein
MSVSTNLVDKLEGVEKLCAWNYRIGLIIEENDLAKLIKGNVSEPEEDVAKAKYKKDMVRAKRIIADSIKYHLIPQVSSKDTPKYIFDALTRMYEGMNINRKMNLRTQLKNTKMQKGEIVHDYFSRVTHFKEKLEAIGDNLDEDELIMTTLNGLTRPWDAFDQTICARKEKLQFDSLWEECVQEEARVANREVVLLRDEDQALAAHTKGGKKRSHFQKETHPHNESHSPKRFIHKESHPPRRFQKYHKGQRKEKYFSSYQCYHCHKMGQIAKNCPSRREHYKKRNNKRHHAHAFEDDEPPKKVTKEEIEDYVLSYMEKILNS